MLRLIGIIFFVFTLANVAEAQGWTDAPSGGSAVTEVRTGNFAYYDFSDTTASSILKTFSARDIDIRFNEDALGTATGGCEVRAWKCDDETTDGCVEILEDRDGDGTPEDVTLNGDESAARSGYERRQVSFLLITVDANPNGDDCRVFVTGH